jgi:hypothetical protein
MSDGDNPFRSELEAAHHRIETLATEHAAAVSALERENARLRERLIDQAPSRNATGRTFAALGMIILGLSLAAGIVMARITGRPAPMPMATAEAIELEPEHTSNPPADGDFNRSEVASAFAGVRLEDCARGNVRGWGHAKITIAPSGQVTTVTLDYPGNYHGTPAGACIEERFRSVRVAPFTGVARVVGKSFVIP